MKPKCYGNQSFSSYNKIRLWDHVLHDLGGFHPKTNLASTKIPPPLEYITGAAVYTKDFLSRQMNQSVEEEEKVVKKEEWKGLDNRHL